MTYKHIGGLVAADLALLTPYVRTERQAPIPALS